MCDKKPRSCELAVDSIDNKVAFGVAFPRDDIMSNMIHGRPLESGCLRVMVDGAIKPDALLPVPIPDEAVLVYQAVGSHVAWPENLITYPTLEV